MRTGLLVVLVVVGLASGCLRRRGGNDVPAPLRYVSPGVAFEMLRDGGEELPLVDVRSEAEYMAGHLAGARGIPLDQLEFGIATLESHLRRSVLLYGGPDGEAETAALALRAAGFRFPIVLRGGIEGWRSAGFGIVEPAPIDSVAPDERPASPTPPAGEVP